jgi:hypothetical protein
MSEWSMYPDSRYLDHAESERANVVLYDLLALVNTQDRTTAGGVPLSGGVVDTVRVSVGDHAVSSWGASTSLPVRVVMVASWAMDASDR